VAILARGQRAVDLQTDGLDAALGQAAQVGPVTPSDNRGHALEVV
jgi:hypothetical protein